MLYTFKVVIFTSVTCFGLLYFLGKKYRATHHRVWSTEQTWIVLILSYIGLFLGLIE